MKFKKITHRGQVMVMYALLIPLLFLFVGVGLDLGWYYLNVSRLQNAADAAALAGAKKIIDDTTNFTEFSGTYILVSNRTFTDDQEFDGTDAQETTITNANNLAKKYVIDNIGESRSVQQLDENNVAHSVEIIADSWNQRGDPAVTLTPGLYQDGLFYYVVSLKEKIRHLFMPGWFDDMDAPVTAVVLLNPKEVVVPPDFNIKELEAVQVIADNWEVEAAKSRGKWTDPTANTNTNNPYRENYFVKKTTNAYEGIWHNYNSQKNENKVIYQLSTVEIKPGNMQDGGSTSKKNQDNIDKGIDYSKGAVTKNSNNANDTQNFNPDSLTLGFRQDIVCVRSLERGNKEVIKIEVDDDGNEIPVLTSGNTTGNRDTDSWFFESDWDLRYRPPATVYDKMLDVMYINQGSRDGTLRLWNKSRDLRIHNCYTFSTPFEDRYTEIPESGESDILYCRVESEAFIDIRYLGVTDRGKMGEKPSHFEYKSVRQIILNMNKSNFDVTDAAGNVTKRYRPVCLFYMGPERYDMNSTIRASQPVILNINADFRGILYAPFSPVVINIRDGCKFEGFVVAKEYHKLKQSGFKKINDKDHGNVEMWVDEYGNVQTVRTSMTKLGEYSNFNHPGFPQYNSAGNEGANLFISNENTKLY